MARNDQELVYELNISPRASIDSRDDNSIAKPQLDQPEHDTTPAQPTIQPSIRLLFSLLSRKHRVLLLTPAFVSSIVAGGIAPFMTFVIGQAFDAFAKFPLSNPTEDDKKTLLHDVGIAALQLVGLAVGSFALGSLTSCLWIWIGEVNVMTLRKKVYRAVLDKDLTWFDLHTTEETKSDGPVGAGGLMAKFARETDDLRMSTSLSSGSLLQYLTTCITCLVLAFVRSWSLTLVILASVPILIIVQAISQALASPLLGHERNLTAVSATLIDRALNAISTVKAFTAESYELNRAQEAFERLEKAGIKLTSVWAFSSGVAQFVMWGMFVQAFWFGAKLVREEKASAGDVMAVFWACLIATSNLQMCIPQLISIAKGKFAMVSLLTLVEDQGPKKSSSAFPPPSPVSPISQSSIAKPVPRPLILPTMRKMASTSPRTLKKIIPSRCYGELALHNVTFSYPSSSRPVLDTVSLFLPAHETTFIVGSSGSGKSTLGQILMGLYTPDHGSVCLDEQDVRFLDRAWVCQRVLGVGQRGGEGGVVLEGKSVWENVLMGFGIGSEVTEEEREKLVEQACRAALVHEFVRDLQRGYETLLGGPNGVGLSGGQMQRLEIARARVRNPEVLVLDEATSALDPTSRILVFEAIKLWRRNKTTIVITHDLSQITSDDFVYVLKDGRVAEQGYRSDLEVVEAIVGGEGRGEFRKMMEAQRLTGGFLPEKEIPSTSVTPMPHHLDDSDSDDYVYDDETEDDSEDEIEQEKRASGAAKHHSVAIRPLTYGNWSWMLDVVSDLTTKHTSFSSPNSTTIPTPAQTFTTLPTRRSVRPMSAQFMNIKGLTLDTSEKLVAPTVLDTIPASPASVHTSSHRARHFSMPVTPSTPGFAFPSLQYSYPPNNYSRTSIGSEWVDIDSREKVEQAEEDEREEERKFTEEKKAVELSGVAAQRRVVRERRGVRLEEIKVESAEGHGEVDEMSDAPPSFWRLSKAILPSVPHKFILVIGLLACVASGAMTPIFSFLLSRLLFEVSIGAQNVSLINAYGGLVLGIAALDGILLGSKFMMMEWVGMKWITNMRVTALGGAMKQDRAWFDGPSAETETDKTEVVDKMTSSSLSTSNHSPAKLVQTIVKDGDDARNLISVVFAQTLVVSAMLGVGLIWALVQGWELTLAGLGIGPVFAVAMAVQSKLVAKCERRNKRAREEVAKKYYDTIIHIRGIRCMAYDPLFEARFVAAADKALTTGVRGAFVEGCTYGIASGLIYLAEALLFYVGAVLIINGRYTYLQMIQVLNLVVFTVTIGSQLMAFTERIAKSVQATHELYQLTRLSTNHTSESHGTLRPHLDGTITFSNVTFAYPSRPTQIVLKDLNLTIQPGECVAIVGSSGSGKSTVAALLQRLYEPNEGAIFVGDGQEEDALPLSEVDVHHLRSNLSVVSQHPHLFDASVSENIRYGAPASTTTEVDVRIAAKKANVHEFVMQLDQGYDTSLGENASKVSGGQAQRLQIARALLRGGQVLILDECTSALDAENEGVVLDTIRGLVNEKERGRTTVMITHKLGVMQMCDRVVVLQDGRVVEEGKFDELVQRKGVFASLAGGGEWIGE